MSTQLRLALRNLARSPGFTVIAILTLALGIGISTASFCTTDAFLLRDLPYPQSKDLYRIFRTAPQMSQAGMAPGNYYDLKASARSFEQMEATSVSAQSYMDESGLPTQVYTMGVTSGFFDMLRVLPLLGRNFLPGDDQPGKPKTCLLTWACWQHRFASDSKIVGRSIKLDGDDYMVIGVLPRTFEFPLVWGPVGFITPLVQEASYKTIRADGWFQIIGRLRHGTEPQVAQTELSTIAARLATDHPVELSGCGLRLAPLKSAYLDDISRGLLWLMVGLALLVLLVACANLAGLQLTRAFARAREFALRSALGGSRWQLMQPLLIESLVLSLCGGLLGTLLASWCVTLMGRHTYTGNGYGFDISLNGAVLVFALAVSVFTGLAFGLIPAWMAAQTQAADALREGGRGATAGRTHHRLRSALIIAEVAISLTLIATAFSFSVASHSILNRDLGWDSKGLFHAQISRPWSHYGDENVRRASDRAIEEQLSRLPGAETVALSTASPLFGYDNVDPFSPNGSVIADKAKSPTAAITSISKGYFPSLRMRLLEGRNFEETDTDQTQPVAIINQALADAYFKGRSPLGHALRLRTNTAPVTIVGVVGNVQAATDIGRPASPFRVYRPLLQESSPYLTILLRTQLDPATLKDPVRKVIASLDGNLALSEAGDAQDIIRLSLSNLNLVTANLAVYGLMGLLISAIGLYGVVANLTAQRNRDIGVRMALGATPAAIQRLVLMEGAKLAAWGLLGGSLLAWWANRILVSIMQGYGLPGLWSQLISMLFLGLVTLLACWLPARRAARLNPAIALS